MWLVLWGGGNGKMPPEATHAPGQLILAFDPYLSIAQYGLFSLAMKNGFEVKATTQTGENYTYQCKARSE